MTHTIDTPPSSLDLRGMTTCDQTGELIKLKDALVVTKHFGRTSHQLHFKDEDAANAYYLNHLRSIGL